MESISEAPEPKAEKSNRASLDASELADAAIAAALVFALLAFGRLLAAGSFFQLVGTVVFAVLAARHRTRTLVMSVLATMLFTVMLGGTAPFTQSIISGLFGWTGGVSLAKRRSIARTVGLTLAVAWPGSVARTLIFFSLAKELRVLAFENATNIWNGFSRILNAVGLSAVSDGGASLLETMIDWWYLAVPIAELPMAIVYALLVRRLGRRVLRGVDDALGPVEPFDLEDVTRGFDSSLPIRLDNTTLRRGDHVVAESVNLVVEVGADIAIAGRNGAGKSTLLETLAGLVDNDEVVRPTRPGLGSVGGIAYVGQRPEGQVLAPTVEEDIRWGSPADVDVTAALQSVGLDGFAQRLTSELSGGELQRLAIASALARRPTLLLVDEVTAMLDPEGRVQINRLLREVRDRGVAIVRTSHLAADFDEVDQVVTIGEPQTTPPSGLRDTTFVGHEVLRLDGVSYTFNAGRPWAREVLSDIDLIIHTGELILISGSNGSGKSTLARIIVGLLRPSAGSVDRKDDINVSIAFQHARLQLMKPTVDEEIRSLAGAHTATPEGLTRLSRVPIALSALGIAGLQSTRVDALSGGQQRRVLLAGLLARGSSVIVLDEPLAGLDDEGRVQLTEVVDSLRRRGTAVVVVTHDPTWGHDRVDQMLRIEDGRIAPIEVSAS